MYRLYKKNNVSVLRWENIEKKIWERNEKWIQMC